MSNPKLIAVPRIGNIQAVIELKGEGYMQRPVVRLSKLVPQEVLAVDPQANQVWEMTEIAALHDLTGRLMTQAYNIQSMVPASGPTEPPEKKPEAPPEFQNEVEPNDE